MVVLTGSAHYMPLLTIESPAGFVPKPDQFIAPCSYRPNKVQVLLEHEKGCPDQSSSINTTTMCLTSSITLSIEQRFLSQSLIHLRNLETHSSPSQNANHQPSYPHRRPHRLCFCRLPRQRREVAGQPEHHDLVRRERMSHWCIDGCVRTQQVQVRLYPVWK